MPAGFDFSGGLSSPFTSAQLSKKYFDKITGVGGPGSIVNGSGDAMVAAFDGSAGFSFSDLDGDALYDDWERFGINADGAIGIELDLPAMHADPMHKDVFVEVDAMTDRAATQETLDRVVAAFAAAPQQRVMNPDNRAGINLHVNINDADIIDKIPFPKGFANFQIVKEKYFGTSSERSSPPVLLAKRLAFRYAIFADTLWENTDSGLAECAGDDFMVTLGRWTTPGGTPDQQAGTFMHELGHTLGLGHGGGDDYQLKPNYYSVMNYLWQTPGESYAAFWKLDYSQQVLNTLDENNLDENAGIGGPAGVMVPAGRWTGGIWLVNMSGPVDWSHSNHDGKERGDDDTGIREDINHGLPPARDPLPISPGQILTGFEDWSHLVYNFRDSAHFSRGAIYVPSPNETELTLEMHEALSGNAAPIAAHDTASTAVGSPVVVSVLTNDKDLDGTIIPGSVVIVTQPQDGTVGVNPITGQATYTPNGGFQGTDRFSYRVADDDSATSNVATVEITVSGDANLPPVAVDDAASTAAGATVVIDVRANDTDAGGTIDPESVAVIASPVSGQIVVNPDGTVTYTPNPGFTGNDSFTYTVADNQGAVSAPATVTVTVTATANQAPTLAPIGNRSVDEGSALTFTAAATDPDIGDLLTFSLVGAPVGTTIDPMTGGSPGRPARPRTASTT